MSSISVQCGQSAQIIPFPGLMRPIRQCLRDDDTPVRPGDRVRITNFGGRAIDGMVTQLGLPERGQRSYRVLGAQGTVYTVLADEITALPRRHA